MARSLDPRKFLIPPSWAAGRSSEALTQVLDSADGRHVLVTIPPRGSGGLDALETREVVARWARRSNAAWLTLDAEDADLGSFTEHLVRVFELNLKAFETEAHALDGRAFTPVAARAALLRLAADLREQVLEPLVVVLDRYDLASTPHLDDLARCLMAGLPDAVRLLVILEQDHPLTTQAAGDRVAIAGPAARVFAGEPPAPAAGPPAGRTRQFLTLAATVSHFDERFCQEALDSPLMPDRRDQLLQQGFVLRVDETTFSVSPDLQAALGAELAAQAEDLDVKMALRRIGDYLWRSGRALGALHCWSACGQIHWAIDRLVFAAEDWLAEGRLELLWTALSVVGDHRRSQLYLAEGEILQRWSESDLGRAAFERAQAGFEEAGDLASVAVCDLRLAEIALVQGDLAQAEERLARCQGQSEAAERLGVELELARGTLAAELARRHPPAGQLLDAAKHLAQARRLAAEAPRSRALARAATALGTLQVELGDFESAASTLTAALQAVGDLRPPEVPILLARAHLASGNLWQARQAADEALSLARLLGIAGAEATALELLGRILAHSGELDRAGRSFADARRLAEHGSLDPGLPDPDLQGIAAAEAGELDCHGVPRAAIVEISERALGPAEPPPIELCVQFFGGLLAWIGGTVPITEADWRGRQSRILLAYLLHHEAATLAELQLALLGPKPAAAGDIRPAIVKLRRVLEPTRPVYRVSRFLVRHGDRYSFNRQAQLEIDTWRFEATLRPVAGETPEQEMVRLETALALYVGAFLPDVDLPWAVALRERFEEQARRARARLEELGQALDPPPAP